MDIEPTIARPRTTISSRGDKDTKRPSSPPDALIEWSHTDKMVTALFGPWDDFPPHSEESGLANLRALDDIIVMFDEHIGHSDDGFRTWRKRHQAAMDAGLTTVPSFPQLFELERGKRVWTNHSWEKRYYHLVTQRMNIVNTRLQRIGIGSRPRSHFFRRESERPRRLTISIFKKGPKALAARWYEPLDVLLAELAEETGWHGEELAARFWGAVDNETVRRGTALNLSVKLEDSDSEDHKPEIRCDKLVEDTQA